MLPENRKEEGLVQVRPLVENAAYSAVQASARAGLVPWRRIRRMVRAVVQKVEAHYPSLNTEVRYLSGGNQQKVVIAKWLAARSDVLILDEPTRGVDVGARAEIYKLMQQFKQEGKAILMISFDLTEIITQSDRILVMAQGRIVGEFSKEEATEEKVMSMALGVERRGVS
jgi:ribose transport system ATP-binding protein